MAGRLIRKVRMLGIAIALALLGFIPTEVIARGPTLCIFKRAFDIECFGCGMTRALSALLHADLAAALAYNKLVLIVFPLLLGILIRDAAILLRATRQRREEKKTLFADGFGLSFLISLADFAKTTARRGDAIVHRRRIE